VQEQVSIGPGTRVAVIGDGRLGQLVARTLALTGCELRVAGRHPDKLARLSRLGIATAAAGGLQERAADVVVECTGNPGGLEQARRAVRRRGTIVLKSTYAGAATVDLSSFVVDEITLAGSRCGAFDKAVALLAGPSGPFRPRLGRLSARGGGPGPRRPAGYAEGAGPSRPGLSRRMLAAP
jgi:threonine dehydrogenase-like Zn-dependent dehydrogenase